MITITNQNNNYTAEITSNVQRNCLYKNKGKPSIAIIGVGDAGGSWINKIMEINDSTEGIEYVYINKACDSKYSCNAPTQIILETFEKDTVNRNHSNSMLSEPSKKHINYVLEEIDIVFIVCGLGGKTGSLIAPLIAQLAKASGVFTVVICSKPFNFEGKSRNQYAITAIKNMLLYCDLCFTIINNKIFEIISKDMSVADVFRTYDKIVHKCIFTIIEIAKKKDINNLFEIQIELAQDFKKYMTDGILSVEQGKGNIIIK